MGIKDFSDRCSNIFVSQCTSYNPTYNLTLLAQYRCSTYNLSIYFLVIFKIILYYKCVSYVFLRKQNFRFVMQKYLCIA